MNGRVQQLCAAARAPHRGVFLVGVNQLDERVDDLPDDAFDDEHIVTASLTYCRCSSDNKAIQQFSQHARVPDGLPQIALGHETVQQVLHAPADSGMQPGEIILVTPGHAATPVDPLTFREDPDAGVLASLGYSYRYFGALRPFNSIPAHAVDFVAGQGFGDLFSTVPSNATVSLATLTHAEPYACCYGSNTHIYFRDEDGSFRYNVPPRAIVALLSGTARMGMIHLTIMSNVPDSDLPQVIYITGSQRKLDELDGFALIKSMRARGVEFVLLDRNDPAIGIKLIAHGRPDVVWTNYPAQDVYDQAVAAVRPGGNINSYAGAADTEIGFHMRLAPVDPYTSLDLEAADQVARMHHNLARNDFHRYDGPTRNGLAHFVGFAQQPDRLAAYLRHLPEGHRVSVDQPGLIPTIDASHAVHVTETAGGWDDVFISGSGDPAAASYAAVEPALNRGAAVNLVDGDTIIFINSRFTHYTSRHQICGPTIPYTLTNTSEPVSRDLARQGTDPIDFDWLVRGVCGLDHTIAMIEDVNRTQAFGSFFCFIEIPALPYVAVSALAFREMAAAPDTSTCAATALRAAADILEADGDAWSRAAEEAIYAAYGLTYPLAT